MNRNASTGLLILVLWLLNVATGNSPLLATTEKNLSTTSEFSESNFNANNDYACIGNVIVELDEDCRRNITIPMVLKGTGVDTVKGFNVLITYPNGSATLNYVQGCGDFTYEVFDREDVLVCWGNIKAEDKIAPVIAAPLKSDILTCTDVDSILNKDLYDFDGKVWQRLRDQKIIDIDTAITDNCSDLENISLFISDDFIQSPESCEEFGRIERRIQATDEKGNVSEVVKIVFIFLQPELLYDEIKDVELNICSDGAPYVLNAEEVGAPYYYNAFGNRQYVYATDTSLCNYAVTFRDDSTSISCGFKLVRTWIVTDWCDLEDPRDTIVQNIKFGDFEAPEVFCRPVPYNYSTGPFDCTATIDVPSPIVRDCNTEWTYYVEVYTKVPELNPFGIPTGDSIYVIRTEPILGDAESGYMATGIPVGEHSFYYYVSDACGNMAEVLKCEFVVEDNTAPVAACFDLVNVSLGGKGIGSVSFSDVDEGSTDNCEIESLQLRREINEDCLDAYVDAALSGNEGRYSFSDLVKDEGENIWRHNEEIVVTKKGSIYYSAYMDDVIVNCCDIGTIVTIEMRVVDKAGNTNSCWSLLQIEDKLSPLCLPPDDVLVDCDTALLSRNEYSDTTILQQYYGKAQASDNCNAIAVELTPVVNVDQCGFGTITRRFQAIDTYGNKSGICMQTITIRGIYDYELKFPADESSIVCGVSDPDTLLYELLACENIIVNVEEEIFDAADDACYKIFRTYSVMNWCEYDGISDPLVIGRDEDKDGIIGEEVFLLRRRDGTFYIDENNNEEDGFIRSGTSGGFWQYTQIIKVYDNQAPVLSFGALDPFCSYDTPSGPEDICNGDVMVPFTVSDNCTIEELETRVFLDEGSDGQNMVEITNSAMLSRDGQEYTFTGSLPIGPHRLQVRVVDPCGNFIVKAIPFEVIDCKAPFPICIQGVTVELMPVDQDGNGVPDFGMNLVPARALIGSEVFDCSGEVTYSINRKGETASMDQNNLMVTCLDPKNETLPIEIHAWDKFGNHQPCETFIVVQDNGKFCSGGIENGIISGAIYTEEDIPLEDVNVRLSGNSSAGVKTDFDGVFEFIDLEEGNDYSVEPQKNVDFKNGVSTYDLVLVSKHILGVDKLESPYQVIAADVNRSNSVTSLDLIHLRKLILSINDTFPNNTSWRFVARDHVFPEPERPWVGGIPEVVNVNNLIGTFDQANFIAIKIGDINLSARINPSFAQNENRDTKNPMTIHVEDLSMVSGQEYELNFSTADLMETMACQFTLSFDPQKLNLVDLHYGLFQEEHLGLKYLQDGLLTISWNQLQKPTESSETILFKLKFRALDEIRVAEAFQINSRLTQAEAYSFVGQLKNINLGFTRTSPELDLGYDLYQNHPNPFKEYTYIRFSLPKEAEANILIHDISGKLIKTYSGHFTKGINELKVSRDEIPKGLLFYTLQSGDYQKVKKMILID